MRLSQHTKSKTVAAPSRDNRRPVCIACPELNVWSETFISNHINGLRLPVRVLHGRPLRYDDNGRDVYEQSLVGRLLWRARKKVLQVDWKRFCDERIGTFLGRAHVVAVLAEYGPTGAEVMGACEKAGIPLIVHFHGYDAYVQEIVESYKEQYGRMFASAAGIVAVSRAMEERLVKLGAPPGKVAYVPCGVDTTMFRGANPGAAEPVFLAVGRFVEKKAPYLTLHAFAKVVEVCPEARLVMVGDGLLLGPCRHLAAMLGIAEAVEFAGLRSHAFVSERMKSSRAFVQHSICASNGDCEGTPVAVMEAQASGLPVVATRHTGIAETVVHGQTGLLVDEFDVCGMAGQMLKLARDSVLAARLGEAGRQRMGEHFRLDHKLNDLAKLIENVVTGGVFRAPSATDD